MRTLVALLSIPLLAAPLNGQSRPLLADPDSAAVRELVALEHHLNTLLLRRDWQAYAAYVADDYRQTTRQGEVRFKPDVIASLRDPAGGAGQTITAPDSIEVRVYDDVGVLHAVLSGRNRDTGAITFRSRILKVFVRRQGRWFLVAMQGTPLP